MKMDWFRKLILDFSQIDGFAGWLIAKVELDMNNFFSKDITPHVVKLSRNYAVINMCKKCFFGIYTFMCDIIVYLVKPCDINKIKQNKQIAKNDISEKLFFRSAYTIEDIENFTNDIGDTNYIHRTDMPIVPGFLMLEQLLSRMFDKVKDTGKFLNNRGMYMEITFYNPLYAGETIEIYRVHTYIEKGLDKKLSKASNEDLGLCKDFDKDLKERSCIEFISVRYGAACSSIYKAICLGSSKAVCGMN